MRQATPIWNRFGYNIYSGRKTEGAGGYGYGPNKGCSLSLHKRLFMSSYLQGHSIVGSETSQFTADQLPDGAPELRPLGRQHVELNTWFKKRVRFRCPRAAHRRVPLGLIWRFCS